MHHTQRFDHHAPDQFLLELASAFRRFSKGPAITVGQTTWRYATLWQKATSLAADLAKEHGPVAFIGTRSISDYAAVLAIFLSGRTYVPLNPTASVTDLSDFLKLTGATTLLSARDTPLFTALRRATPIKAHILSFSSAKTLPPPKTSRYAYIIATSGSTGPPKAVPITHQNLRAYLRNARVHLDIGAQDRTSQIFDLCFDLSLHDIFVSWLSGAHLHVAEPEDSMDLIGFAHRHTLTVWFSTPSHARKAMLRPDPGRTLPHLRLSMFCGEPLTWGLARKWAGLTAGRLENWYGPSETTIAAARYVLPDTAMEDDGEVVPIGKPIGHMPCAVLQSGELCLGGAQVFDGYLGAARRPNRVYRTGDLVRRGADGTLRFLGRRDGQVKLHGQLVDIPWIEGVIARIAQAETSVLPWPYKVANPDGLVAVLTQSGPVADHVKTRITAALPKHIAPHIVTLPHLPLTPAGKQDVAALAKHVTNALSRQSRRPTRAFDRLVACVHDVNPTLALSDLSQGATLMEAGLDSLAFTAFIARIETEFDLVLTQMDVASLSGMTLRQMVAYLRKTQSRLPLSAGASNPKGTGPLPHRAKRALDFLEKFPAFLQAAHRPIVPMIGSSGFMRGLDSQVVDATLLDLGHDVRAANIGLAMLSNLGLCEICAHITEVAKSGQTTFPIAVLELEVMHLSVLPPAGDIEVLDAFKSGRRRHEVGDSDDPDTIWASQRAGTLTERQGPWRPRDAPARWESQRHSEMREVFAGNVALDPKAVDIWLASVAHLLQVSDRVAVVLHPLDGQVSHLAKGRGHLAALRSRLQDLHRVVLISDDQFVLEPSHFRNFSHLNERGGRHAFSSQLARNLALHLR